jgi:hypothetical protein
MALSKSICGRKRESEIWEWCSYEEGLNRTTCLVVNEKTGLECRAIFSGKNPSNLKKHFELDILHA